MIKIVGLAGLLLLAGLVYEMFKTMVCEEGTTRLHRLPYAILRLAKRKVPVELRQRLYEEEWLPELDHIVRDTEGLPLTRIVRGTTYAIIVLVSVGAVVRTLDTATSARSTRKALKRGRWVYRIRAVLAAVVTNRRVASGVAGGSFVLMLVGSAVHAYAGMEFRGIARVIMFVGLGLNVAAGGCSLARSRALRDQPDTDQRE